MSSDGDSDDSHVQRRLSTVNDKSHGAKKSTSASAQETTVRTRSSRGTPTQVDPSVLPNRDSSKDLSSGNANTWVRKVPPVIGMRERDGTSSGESGEGETPRSGASQEPHSGRVRTPSISHARTSSITSSSDSNTTVEGDIATPSPKPAHWAPSQPASVRLGTHTPKDKDKNKLGTSQPDNSDSSSPPGSSSPAPYPAAPTPSLESSTSTSSLPKIKPNQSMPLLSTLFDQTHALLDRKEEDWAIANYDQLRHVISTLFNSVALIQQMLELVKRIAPIFVERHQEREATNRYKEVMYLAEKVGDEAAAEQIELNLLIADSYILRSELALNDQELAVNIAAYANEALCLCHTHKLHARLEDCKARLDLAEALFCAIFLVNANIVLRLSQILAKKPQEFPRVFKVVERTVHQLFKHQSWLMIRKLYQSGILQSCTQATQKLNDDSYILQMLFIQTQVNLTLLQPNMLEPAPALANSALLSQSQNVSASPAAGSAATANNQLALSTSSNRGSASSGSPQVLGISGDLSSSMHDSSTPLFPSSWLPKDVSSNWIDFRQQLESMRAEINVTELADNLLQPEYVQSVQQAFNQKLTNLIKSVFDYCVEMVGDPPCPFAVFALGSLSRGEAAPYSDLEYGFIIAEESKRESTYWKEMWTIFEFTFVCFGERVGFHIDDQGTPKTPNFRGTPAQLLDLFLHPLDAHDISTAFSMLRPLFITGYPHAKGREVYDTYISLVNRVLTSPTDGGFHTYTKIGALFLEDHLSQLAKWTPKESDVCVELKTNYIQPLVFIITDIALANGCYVQCTNAGVCQLVDMLGDGRAAHLGFSPEFSRSIKTLFLACYALKILAQLHYHEQYEGDKVSVSPQTNVANPGRLYFLTRIQVYWLRMSQSVVLKPLYNLLPTMLNYIKEGPFANANPPSLSPTPGSNAPPSSSPSSSATLSTSNSNDAMFGVPRNWSRVDPIIDAAELVVDPKFDPFTSSRPHALEETKELIRSLIATLIFRNAPASRYRHYYKQLASDFKLLYRAAVTSHASWQVDKVTMLTYIFDSYASSDGTRPLIERLKVHYREHIGSINMNTFCALFDKWDTAKNGRLSWTTPVAVRVVPPVGWHANSRLRPTGSETWVSDVVPTAVTKYESQLGFEVVVSYLHFAVAGFGAPMLDARLMPTQATPAGAGPGPQVPVLFAEQCPGESLATVLKEDPAKIRQIDSKAFTDLVFINLILMCDARPEDFIFEPILSEEANKTTYRLMRPSFASITPLSESVTVAGNKATLRCCNFLFCMSSMLQTVHPYSVEEFLSLSPHQVMSRLIQDVESTNKEWKTRLDPASIGAINRGVHPPPVAGFTSVVNVPHFVIPVFYERMMKLHKVLTVAPRSTHLELLRAVDPIVGHFYAENVLQAVIPTSPLSVISSAINPSGTPSTLIFDRSALLQAANASSSTAPAQPPGNDAMDRFNRLDTHREFPLHVLYSINKSSPKLLARLEALRKNKQSDLATMPSADPVFERSDHNTHMEDIKAQLYNLPVNGPVVFPREEILKSHLVKERLLNGVDFAKIELKKQRQNLLSLYDTVRFAQQLRIRNCPELDQQRLSKLLSGETLRTLTTLDLRGMTGVKGPTITMIASLENLEYLNLSGTDVKSISQDKWSSSKREPIHLDRLIWLSLSKCSGLQYVVMRATNLRHVDFTGSLALSEVKIWSAHRTAVVGLTSALLPFARVFSEVLSTSSHFTESVPITLEKNLWDVASGRDHRLLIHIPLNDPTVKVIAEVIKHSPSLEIVDLSNSAISGDEAFETIVASTQVNTNIKSLDLSGCGVKAAKAQLFAQQLNRPDLKAKF